MTNPSRALFVPLPGWQAEVDAHADHEFHRAAQPVLVERQIMLAPVGVPADNLADHLLLPL